MDFSLKFPPEKSPGHRDINRTDFLTIRGFFLKPLPDFYLQRWFGKQQKVTGTKSPICSGHNPEGSTLLPVPVFALDSAKEKVRGEVPARRMPRFCKMLGRAHE
jgi:hypothetical protein